MQLFELKSYQFRSEREKSWRELEALLGRIERGGMRRLTAEELARLPLLYRAAVSSLGVARAISLDRNLLDYLENLCARAYIVVYGPKVRLRAALVEFFAWRFPSSVRACALHVFAATAIFAAASWVGFDQTRRDPDRFFSFVAEELAAGRTPYADREFLREGLFDGASNLSGTIGGELAMFAAYLATHNSSVGILIFAVGVVPHLLVFLLLWQNGCMLGAMSFVFIDKGLSVEWWSWLLPHGITEITAILLCGAAGLAVGQAVLFPGRRTRMESIRAAGGEAGIVVLGSLSLFLAAGLIEGVFRQEVQHIGVRYALAGGSALVLLAYFTLAGRRRSA